MASIPNPNTVLKGSAQGGDSDPQPDPGSSLPGVSTEARTGGDHGQQGQNVVFVPGQAQKKPSFKEQVIGYAKVTRGTLLKKPEVKEHGSKILEGQATVQEPTSV